ncbi:MAG TPA: DUF1801 domain-containing protein [Steroidobacteraceae bacterium]|nr:DUF1801 domain-containing protein [Steroidobacteraceae bacterium]
MAENKTKPTKVSVAAFLKAKTSGQQLEDSQELVKLFKELTGKPAKMWGPSIVGFDSYHYVYESGREGDAPVIGFSPRKPELVLYLAPYLNDKGLKARLGKHKAGAGCLYVKTLDDIDREVLKALAKTSIAELRKRYPPQR